jgi:hypothetical protein
MLIATSTLAVGVAKAQPVNTPNSDSRSTIEATYDKYSVLLADPPLFNLCLVVFRAVQRDRVCGLSTGAYHSCNTLGEREERNACPGVAEAVRVHRGGARRGSDNTV